MAGSRAGLPGCGSCGRQVSDSGEAQRLLADRAVIWLVAGVGGVEQRRFCCACAPPGPVTDIACVSCGDGPLLAGALTTGPTLSVVDVWLDEHGWRRAALVDPGEGAMLCPECVVFAVDAGRVVRDPAAARHEVEPAHDGQGRWTLW